MKKKAILILQRVNFCFQNTRQIKGLHILNDVCWVFDQKAWFSKDLFQNWYLSYFISTIRLE